MKKMVAIFLAVSMLCITCFAFADGVDFSVRGGISFKSTKEEIVAYEESQGAKVNLNPLETYDTCTWFTTNCILADNISFGGYEAEVIYYFGEDDKLQSILFIPKHYVDDKTSADKQFVQFDGALEKYGTPIAQNGEYLEIETGARDATAYFNNPWFHEDDVGENLIRRVKSDIISSTQRLFTFDDGYVDIQLIEFRNHDETTFVGLGGPFSSDSYENLVSYTFYSEEQIQRVRDKIQEKQDALANDL